MIDDGLPSITPAVQVGQAFAREINIAVTQQIVDQHAKAERKRWTTLSVANYLADDDGPARRTRYALQLCLFLHRVFREEGHASFAGLLQIDRRPNDVGEDVPFYRLVTHQRSFVGAMTEAWRFLWMHGDAAKEREKRQMSEEMNNELRTLVDRWSLKVSPPLSDRLQAVHFHYDRDSRHIEIGRPPILSTDPEAYPEKLRLTSECLPFLIAMQNAEATVVDLDYVRDFYPLFKLWHQFLEQRSWTLGNIRVNIADSEEWDYLNPTADKEIRQQAGRKSG